MGRSIFSDRFLERHAPALLQRTDEADVTASTSALPAFDPDAPLAAGHVYEAFVDKPLDPADNRMYSGDDELARSTTPPPNESAPCPAEPVTPSSGAFHNHTLTLSAPPPPRTNRSPSPVHRPAVRLEPAPRGAGVVATSA